MIGLLVTLLLAAPELWGWQLHVYSPGSPTVITRVDIDRFGVWCGQARPSVPLFTPTRISVKDPSGVGYCVWIDAPIRHPLSSLPPGAYEATLSIVTSAGSTLSVPRRPLVVP